MAMDAIRVYTKVLLRSWPLTVSVGKEGLGLQ
jgi:hypothetical protein